MKTLTAFIFAMGIATAYGASPTIIERLVLTGDGDAKGHTISNLTLSLPGIVHTNDVTYTQTVSLAGSAVQGSVVRPTDATYTDTVTKAGSAVQPTDSTYTDTVSKAGSAVQGQVVRPTDDTYTETVAKAGSALQWFPTNSNPMIWNGLAIAQYFGQTEDGHSWVPAWYNGIETNTLSLAYTMGDNIAHFRRTDPSGYTWMLFDEQNPPTAAEVGASAIGHQHSWADTTNDLPTPTATTITWGEDTNTFVISDDYPTGSNPDAWGPCTRGGTNANGWIDLDEWAFTTPDGLGYYYKGNGTPGNWNGMGENVPGSVHVEYSHAWITNTVSWTGGNFTNITGVSTQIFFLGQFGNVTNVLRLP